MKHKLSITLIILGLFLITQFVGLFLINTKEVPPYLNTSSQQKTPLNSFISILIAFVLSLSIFFFLIQYKWRFFIKLWFSLLIFLCLSIFFYVLLRYFKVDIKEALFYSFLISIFFTTLKVLRPSVIIHNLTEIFIYSGISIVFVQIFTPIYVILFLLIISFYDMWAVWHTKIMQKMAHFQMSEIKIFNGFFIPYLNKEIREKIKKAKNKKEKIKLKVPIAILGGGDIAFTLIPAGVFLINFGLVSALFVALGGFSGLTFLLFFSKKSTRAYPAMPFISTGILLALILYFLIGIL